MPPEQGLDPQPVGGVLDAQVEHHRASERGAVGVRVDLVQPDLQPLEEVVAAEVIEPGECPGPCEHGSGGEVDRVRFGVGQRHPLGVSEHRLPDIVDPQPHEWVHDCAIRRAPGASEGSP